MLLRLQSVEQAKLSLLGARGIRIVAENQRIGFT